ncbi:MAG: 50S ribosomal protein L4 [Fibrobacteres bacterium]|nr:50S ribosomal protein L4 [Fibrobacterota bacterium]
MAEAVVYSKEGKEKGKEVLSEALFNVPGNDALVYEYVKNYLANQRQGTSKAKTRAEVSGGTVKPWRQKGTGRARSGDNTSPIWVRGGKAFGPKPRDYYSLLPVKKRRAAFLCALSEKARKGKVLVLEDLTVATPKTKEFVGVLKNLKVDSQKNLIVVDTYSKELFLAARNIKNTEIKKVAQTNAYDILNSVNLIMSKKAIDAIKSKYEKAGA